MNSDIPQYCEHDNWIVIASLSCLFDKLFSILYFNGTFLNNICAEFGCVDAVAYRLVVKHAA